MDNKVAINVMAPQIMSQIMSPQMLWITKSG